MYVNIDIFFLERKSNIICKISGEVFVIEMISEIKFSFLRMNSFKVFSSVAFDFSVNIFKISSSPLFNNIGTYLEVSSLDFLNNLFNISMLSLFDS